MTDAANQALARFADPSLWVVRDAVPVFDEHEETEGKKLRRFDRAKLQQIADNCNRRERTTGDVCPLVIGHTLDGQPEQNQPRRVGYARNFRVGTFGPANKVGILADFWFDRDRYAEAMEYPRRSVELWPDDEIFDPISLLIRTPQRDLGVLAYARNSHARNSHARSSHARNSRGRDDGRYVYSMEDAVPDDINTAPPPPPAAARPDGDELSPDHKEMADKFMRHYMKSHPLLGHLAKKYGAECGMTFPSGSNGAPPPAAPAGSAAPAGEPERMARESEAIKYARLEEEVKQIRAERDAERKAARYAKAERQAVQLEAEGFELDRARFTAKLTGLLDDQWQGEVADVRKYNRRHAIGAPMLPVTGENVESGRPAQFGELEMQKALKYQREHPGTEWDAAVDHVMGGRA
jgi:hypothetical protein